MHVYPCTPSDVSFAESLRTDSNCNISIDQIKKDASRPSSTKRHRLVPLRFKGENYSLLDDLENTRKIKLISGLPPIDPNNKPKLRTPKGNLHVINRRHRKINSIYDILKEVTQESELTNIPMQKRKKKWIRSIHDLI